MISSELSDWESDYAKDKSLLTFLDKQALKHLFRGAICIQRLIKEGWVGCASRMGERKGRMWLLPTRGDALEVKQLGVRRGQFTALVTLCLRALLLADSTWYVNKPFNPNISPIQEFCDWESHYAIYRD
jgi:hypothetical protein